DVELAEERLAWQFGLIPPTNLRLPDGTATARISIGEGGLEDFIDVLGPGRQAVSVEAMGGAPLAPACLGLGLGRSLGEGGSLAFALAAGFVQIATRLLVFALEALFVLPQLRQLGADVAQLLEDGERHGHLVADHDRRHCCLGTTYPPRLLFCDPRAQTARA